MVYHTAARRAALLALVAILGISTFQPAILAQKRAVHGRTVARLHRQLEGSPHPRPPRTYDVQHYTIHTRFDVPSKTVIGDETVTLRPLAEGFTAFALDASSMQIERVTMAAGDAPLQWDQPPDKLHITLDRAYGPSETIAVRIRYRARPQRGLYFIPGVQGGSYSISKPAQIWTQGEPEDNHYWFPCYDFPDDKATSEQYITTAASQLAISNGALVETSQNEDGTRTFHWKMDQPHASYLISLIVGDYVKLTDAYKNIPVEYYTYHGTEAAARRAFAKTPQMMDWFSRELDYEYPYNKYAQTIVNYFIFGGMENITATTQSDWEILRNGGDDGPGDSKENLVSHELAHSWFGNLVTCKDWSQAWLNEGFATYMEAVFQEHEGGREAYMADLREDARLYFAEDAAQYRRPLVYDRYREPINLFDATLYKKGALVLHMLRETTGDEMFWKSLNRYLKDHQFGTVETADLERAFEQTTGRNLSWFFDQWVYKAGYPELRVGYAYNPAAGRLTLAVAQTQAPDAVTPAVFRLPVDVEFKTSRGARTERIEINRREQQFTFRMGEKPLRIIFDKGARVLMKAHFPQPSILTVEQIDESRTARGGAGS